MKLIAFCLPPVQLVVDADGDHPATYEHPWYVHIHKAVDHKGDLFDISFMEDFSKDKCGREADDDGVIVLTR